MIRQNKLEEFVGKPYDAVWYVNWNGREYRYRVPVKDGSDICIVYDGDAARVNDKYYCETLKDLKRVIKTLNKLSEISKYQISKYID